MVFSQIVKVAAGFSAVAITSVGAFYLFKSSSNSKNIQTSNPSAPLKKFKDKYPNARLISARASDSSWYHKRDAFRNKLKNKDDVYRTFDVSNDLGKYFGQELNRFSDLSSSGWSAEDVSYFLHSWCNDNKDSSLDKVHDLLNEWCTFK